MSSPVRELSIEVFHDGPFSYYAVLDAVTPYGRYQWGQYSANRFTTPEAAKDFVIGFVLHRAAWKGCRHYRNVGRRPEKLPMWRFVADRLRRLGLAKPA